MCVLFSHSCALGFFFVAPILKRHWNIFKHTASWTQIGFVWRKKDRLREIPIRDSCSVLLFLSCAFFHEDKVLAVSCLSVCKWALHHFKKIRNPNCLLCTFCFLLTIYDAVKSNTAKRVCAWWWWVERNICINLRA